ncbi:MAG: hypothetical protein FWG25_07100 [Promicromonosporaceae bacterium]|nr:hypothetical protein [Promicromonosporaceae bacterium]
MADFAAYDGQRSPSRPPAWLTHADRRVPIGPRDLLAGRTLRAPRIIAVPVNITTETGDL